MQVLHGNTHLETNDLTDLNEPRKSASLRVQRRHQRLVALWNTAKRFSVNKVAESLGVSRWTVERDLAFLRKYDLLSPKRACLPPFIVLEKAVEYMNRFNAAHKGKVS